MPLLTITSLLAITYAVLMVALSALTSLRRATQNVSRGDGGDETLRRRIRAHGNFIEYAPLALIIVGLVELSGAARVNTVILAATFLAARLLHAVGMLFVSGPALRAAAMVLQHAGFLFGAILLVKRLMSTG